MLVHTEQFADYSGARKRELELKKQRGGEGLLGASRPLLFRYTFAVALINLIDNSIDEKSKHVCCRSWFLASRHCYAKQKVFPENTTILASLTVLFRAQALFSFESSKLRQCFRASGQITREF
jgi:hypothetical protein